MVGRYRQRIRWADRGLFRGIKISHNHNTVGWMVDRHRQRVRRPTELFRGMEISHNHNTVGWMVGRYTNVYRDRQYDII